MKFWTNQTEKVIEILLNNNVYYPNFSLSRKESEQNYMKLAYNGILEVYQQKNNISCGGLLYGISKFDEEEITKIEQYRNYFEKRDIEGNENCFWDSISPSGNGRALLELELPDDFDYVPINFQDFIVLGMRAIKSEIFSLYVKSPLQNEPFQSFAADLKIAQKIGWTDEANVYYMTQVHYHQLNIDNIVGVYNTIDFSNGINYELGDNAKKLLDIIS